MPMLVSIVICGLILLSIQYLFKKYYGYRIKKSDSVDESVSIRKRMLLVMHCINTSLVIMWFILVLIEKFVLENGDDKVDVYAFWSEYLIIVIIAICLYAYLKGVLNFSIFKKKEFLAAHPSFVLYLRAFSTDDYNAKTNESLSWSVFSEDEFVRSLRGIFPVCAVGMTKEIVAPRGAMRVYVSDATWQVDVRELMERAKLIVILVDDRPSCLWEIEQSSNLLDKAALIVVDKEKYNSARVKVADSIALPDVTDDVPLPFCVCGLNNNANGDALAGEIDVFPFKNSLKGYDAVWDHLLVAGINKRRRRKLRKGSFFRWYSVLHNVGDGCLLTLALITLSMIIIGCFLKGGLWSAIAIVVVILLLMYFFWDVIKEWLRRGKDSMNK